MKREDITFQGLLRDVRVAFSAVSVAGPFFGSMCADYGADVLWIEQANTPSIDRASVTGWLEGERKNMRSIGLDIPSEEGRKVFLDIIKNVDIFLESSKGGQYERWGLTDEVLWEVNPKLVIIHISGFGLTGVPEYVAKASYDPIAQAFGGMMYINQRPGDRPVPALSVVSDYYTGHFAFGAAMAAYINVLKTGVGDSVDISQFEALTRCTQTGYGDWNYPIGSPNAEKYRFEIGNINVNTAGYNSYQCGDGEWVFMLIFGTSVMKRAFPIFGLEYGSENLPLKAMYKLYDPEGQILEKAIEDYCMAHTAAEVEKVLSDAGCAAMRSITYDQMLTHPHYIARETFVTYESKVFGKNVTVPNIFPKVKKNPGKIWRPAPLLGQDTDDILSDLGYSSERIEELAENKIIKKQ